LIIPRSEHAISRANISKSALKVLYRLKDSGYQAFLVGGSVRDLLLDRHPKDFDVATNAKPEEVRALFSNSRLIGRRFRLAHVRFGREIIEVATFRGSGADQNGQAQVFHESGRIIADNVYGDINQDAQRRDFTVNALYYDIADFSVWDFADGVTDVKSRCLRLIGDPQRRYREDPVRMLRAVRFAAKLGFQIHPDTAAPIPAMAELIDGVPPARLFDEFLKMFQAGHAHATGDMLRKVGLFEHLFPVAVRGLDARAEEAAERLIKRALQSTDQRVINGKPITPMFLFAVILWHPVRERVGQIVAEDNLSEGQAFGVACGELSSLQAKRMALPRRFSLPMREVLQLQPRFLKRRGRRSLNLLNHPRFRAAYDLLMLRASSGEVEREVAEFWTRVQLLSAPEQRKAFGVRQRRRRPPAPTQRSSAASRPQ
jgi:poly(A) polymerase